MAKICQRGHRGRALIVACTAFLVACSDSELPDDETQPARAPEVSRIVPAQEALAGAHIPTLDPATMHDAEIEKALGTQSYCTFKYTSAGEPVLGISSAEGTGVVKVNGKLISLHPPARKLDNQDKIFELQAEPVRITVEPNPSSLPSAADTENLESTVVFEIGEDLRVGYRGYLSCGDKTVN